MKKLVLTVIVLLSFATLSYAGSNDIKAADITTSDALKSMTNEVGYAISIPSMTSADPLGLTLGIDIGIEVSAFKVDETKDLFDDDALILARVHVQKGLPFSIDVGAEYSKAYNSNIQSIGGEIRYAIFDDSVVFPAIGLRGTYSKLISVDDVNLTTYGANVQVSKEIVFITPYIGASYLISNGKVDNESFSGSEKEANQNVYVGVNISALLANLTVQADFAEIPMYTLKLGIAF